MCLLIMSGCMRFGNKDQKAQENLSVVAGPRQVDIDSIHYLFLIVPEGSAVKNTVPYTVVGTTGCKDKIVRVIEDDMTTPNLALEKLFAYKGMKIGVYNSLEQSQLTVDHIIKNDKGDVDVYVKGLLYVGGMCDNSRVLSQITYTVKQFDPNVSVNIFVNDKPLGEIMSENGE